MATRSTATSIDAYIAEFPTEVQTVLQEMRAIIRAAAPQATETISYAMPTFDLNGHLVHFAGYKSHIGFYPTSSGIEAFKDEITAYKHAIGSVQFPLGRPLPRDLIRRIVEFRVQESTGKTSRAPKRRDDDLPPGLASPARRALNQAGYSRLDQLARLRVSDLRELHGIGPKAIDQLRAALAARGLTFVDESGE